jgi:hypothetical protein
MNFTWAQAKRRARPSRSQAASFQVTSYQESLDNVKLRYDLCIYQWVDSILRDYIRNYLHLRSHWHVLLGM